MIVVADTGPVNYLILSGHIHLVPELYGSLLLPPAVYREFLDHKAPKVVQEWANALPFWAEVRVPQNSVRFLDLGPGEREAIALALEARADILLIDETFGRQVAVQNGIAVKGTLGILEEAACHGLVDLPEAVRKLQSTSIFISENIVQTVLERHRRQREEKQPTLEKPSDRNKDLER